MIPVRYRRRAVADLQALRAYYLPIDPAALDNVLDDIERSISLLREHPFAGPAMESKPIRWTVSRRYGFKITYMTDGETLQILGIFRYQNRTS